MKKYLPAVIAALTIATIASAGALKTWVSGETIRAADLNSNFSHVHTYMVGGGAQGTPHNSLVDSDVSSSAAVAHSKLATPGLVPKAWVGYVNNGSSSPCDGAAAADTACSFSRGSQKVTRVSSNGTAGQYRVYLSYLPANAVFTPQVTRDYGSGFDTVVCWPSAVNIGTTYVNASSTAQINVTCQTTAGVATNASWSLIVFDDNN